MALNTPALPTKAIAFVPPAEDTPEDFFSQAKCRFYKRLYAVLLFLFGLFFRLPLLAKKQTV